MNNYDLKNKHAVITGGASGIGFAIAMRMVASGATVTLWDRDSEALFRAASQLGAAAQTVQLDLADHPQVVKATADTVAHSPTQTCRHYGA
jgi:2-dehydro-3-deoxy-L-rhamnonate dehydrogenase (NAD+)